MSLIVWLIDIEFLVFYFLQLRCLSSYSCCIFMSVFSLYQILGFVRFSWQYFLTKLAFIRLPELPFCQSTVSWLKELL